MNGKGMEGIDRGSSEVLTWNVSGRNEKQRKLISVWIIGATTETRTRLEDVTAITSRSIADSCKRRNESFRALTGAWNVSTTNE
jgi:hypothetical protein